MKKLFLLFPLLIFAFSLFGLDTDVSYTSFKAGDKQYVEVSVFVVGNTVEYASLDSLTGQAAVEVLMLIKQGEAIVQFEKYILNGPQTSKPVDFLDLKRFILNDGTYTLEVTVKDMNKTEEITTFSENFNIGFSDTALELSDIQLLASVKPTEGTPNVFSKSGYQIEPLPFNFYNKRSNRLIFYTEIYNSDKAIADDFLISYAITEITNTSIRKPISIGHKRKKAAPVVILLLQNDITELKSGNYELSVEVRNRENELILKKSTEFQRANPYLNIQENPATDTEISDEFVQELSAEELNYALRAIAVILNDKDGEHLNTIIRSRNQDAQKLYLFNYFAQQNPIKPYEEYLGYMRVAKAIDDLYDSGFGYGFETDRGYVYMKYGQPSDILTETNDPSAPPYEVWSYNDFPQTNQSLVKFIFYNPSLSPGNYILLHSTARGEVNNPSWQQEMYKNVPNSNNGADMNGQGAGFGNGRNAGRNWTDW